MIYQSRSSQRGATLVVALIMLVLLTLFALSAMNTSNVSLKIANNMQTRAEAFNAAQQVLERLVSLDFTKDPATTAAAIPKSVDVNNDGTPDYDVVLATPTCIGVIPIKTSQLNITLPDDAPCFGSGAVTTSGIVKGGKGMGSTGNSLCSNSKWETNATATDPVSRASVSVGQGIGVRVAVGAAC
jgi:hypothetical protein